MKKKFALMLAVSMAVGTVLTGCGDAAGKAADTQANEAETGAAESTDASAETDDAGTDGTAAADGAESSVDTGLVYAVEAGSAGEAAAQDNGLQTNVVASQADALMEVAAGTSDAAIIDLLMAGAMIGEAFPDKETAMHELEIAGQMNPGPWTKHSYNVANAAEIIAEHSRGMSPDKAFVCGLLHDIGRRTGISALRHNIDGYDYATSKGWDEVARICITHSFPVKDIEADIAKKDISKEQYDFINNYLNHLEYDDYDKLIILCDALADANGFCILEKR